MFLTEVDPTFRGGLIGGLIVLVPIIGGWLIRLIITGRLVLREGRKDALMEWQQIAADQRVEMGALESRLAAAEQAEAACRVQVAELKGEIRLLSSNVRRLQEQSGDTPPGVILPVQVIADMNGMVLSATPSLGPMFHWLPAQLIKKNIELLMPDRIRSAHKAALAKLVAEGRNPDPDRPILSYGLTKDGEEFPILINLSGWSDVDGRKFITAEIRRRYGGESTVMKIPPLEPEKR